MKEVLAALKRIEAIAHYYGRIAGQSDEITQAFKAVVDEAGDAIAEIREAFIFEHERKHAEIMELLHMQRLTKEEQAND